MKKIIVLLCFLITITVTTTTSTTVLALNISNNSIIKYYDEDAGCLKIIVPQNYLSSNVMTNYSLSSNVSVVYEVFFDSPLLKLHNCQDNSWIVINAYSTYVGYGYITSGSPVTFAQVLLFGLGYVIDIDSYFGEQTRGAVVDYQSKHSLSVDGIVGPNTWLSMYYTAIS